MPTYEFRCPNGHEFERFYRKISDAASELPCPDCGAVAARQLSAGAGLLFKGSGFYLTDYGKNAHRKAPTSKSGDAKSDKSADPSKDGKSGTSERTSPEPKPAESTKPVDGAKTKPSTTSGSGDAS